MHRPLRIALVTSQFPVGADPQRGRPLLQTAVALAALADVRVVVPVAAYSGLPLLRPRGYLAHAASAVAGLGVEAQWVSYPAVPLVGRPFNGRLAAQAIAPLLEAIAPDVVLAYWVYPDGAAAVDWSVRHGVPVVVGSRGSDLRVPDRVTAWLSRRALQRADHVLTVSADLGRIASARYGIPATRISVVPNGCDTRVFHPQDRGAARAALGLPPAGAMVLYVGRLVAEKGLRELVDAIAMLGARGERVSLVLVGEGPLEAELRTRIASHGLQAQVSLAGRHAPAAVARWMAAADVLALPSYSEGHPNVLVEALACGRPAVSCPVGGVPEVIDPESGELVPPRDAAALADGLSRVLRRSWDPAALAARHGRSWAEVAAETLAACEAARRARQPAAMDGPGGIH